MLVGINDFLECCTAPVSSLVAVVKVSTNTRVLEEVVQFDQKEILSFYWSTVQG